MSTFTISVQDRAEGALLGAWIGDALGLGPHWYYSLEELRRDYGDWIDRYTDPKPGRYHDGMKAGQLSQSGFILKLMVAHNSLSGKERPPNIGIGLGDSFRVEQRSTELNHEFHG